MLTFTFKNKILSLAFCVLISAMGFGQLKFPQDFAAGKSVFTNLKPASSALSKRINANFLGLSSVPASPYYEIYESDPGSTAGVAVLRYESTEKALAVLKQSNPRNGMVYLYQNNYLIVGWADPDDEVLLHRIVFNYTDKGAKIFLPKMSPLLKRMEMATQAKPEYTTAVVAPGTIATTVDTATTAPGTTSVKKTKPTKAAIPPGAANRDLERRAYDEMEKKNYDTAIKLYSDLIRKEPKNERAYYNIAWIYATTDRPKQAIEVAEKGLKAIPAEERGGLYRMIGNSHASMNDFKTASEYLKKSLLIDGDDANSLYNLGYDYYKLHQYDKAVYFLNRSLDAGYSNENKASRVSDLYFYIGTSLGEMGRYDEALTYYDKALSTTSYFSYYFNKAEALINLGRMDDALKVANLAVEKEPKNAQVYFKRHQIYRQLGNNAKDAADLKKAYELDSNDPDILQDMGVMYEKNNEMTKAFSMYNKAIAKGAEKDLIYVNMANIYSDNRITKDSAEYYYKKAIAINPRKPEHYYNYGNFFKKNERYDDAVKMFKKAIEVNPDFSAAYNNLYVVYKYKKDDANARATLQKGLQINPDDYELNSNMVGLSENDKNYKDVITYADKALLLKPNSGHKLELLNARANARLMLGQPQDAIYDYLDMMKLNEQVDPEMASGVYSNVGFAYLELNKPADAEKYFKQSMQKKEGVDAAIGMMLVYQMQKKTNDLAKARTKAIEIEPSLKDGMKGIEKLMQEGYFYTDAQMKMLREIFK